MPTIHLPAEIYRDLLAAMPCPVVVHDADGRVIEANSAFATLLGYSLSEVHQLASEQVIHPADRPQRNADAARIVGGKIDGLAAERRLLRRDGSVIRARVRKAAADSDSGRIVMVVIDDWTHEAETLDELRHAITTDELTGALTRRGIWQHLDALPAESYPLVVAVLDVDRLKSVNDTHGHVAGDAVLRAVAETVALVVAPDGVAGRRSGDEFVAIAPASLWTPEGLADVIRSRLAAGRVTLPGTEVRLSTAASVGAAHLARPDLYSQAFNRADAAMYEDKRLRR